ncbi:MAG: hypothetical protein AMS23_00525 [Bacteroides sp. SM1_62]|nr:MAG: hypothetical protein AMS26_01150 [Bacteroides sp. SM23_62]KPL26723.1 MAG: hypothetical protein AMS23_00525 [Bacteroides sp. SM1_62]
MTSRILFQLILSLLIALNACREIEIVDPQIETDDKDKGIYVNPDFLRPTGIDTLFINEGDTLELAVTTILINSPNYSWQSNDESVLKIIPDPVSDSLAYAIAVGDSGTQTTFTITDYGNDATKRIYVRIVKYWADPLFYSYIGKLDNHYYYLSRYKKTWIEAKAECEKSGGHLVTITSEEENTFISEAPLRNNRETWIGLTFLFNSELKRWITGELITYEYWAGIGKPGDPGIFAEYYFYMDPEGRWENWHEILYQYVLEIE